VGDDAGGSVQRTLRILEVVASRGGASAREISDGTGLPLPTVYRLVRELLDSDYLVHIREEHRFELGYKLHQLGVSLHEQIGVPRQVRAELVSLHQRMEVATYLAIHRGAQIVVVFTADSPQVPRLTPIDFGFHEAAHATALGKILLAGMTEDERERHLGAGPLAALTASTITDRTELHKHLDEVASEGIAWEYGEFQDGATCAAAAVRSASGSLIGSVAVSAPDRRYVDGAQEIARALRESAARVSRFYRTGSTSAP
jgi:DNA-binding IclR family transcriptional regulator